MNQPTVVAVGSVERFSRNLRCAYARPSIRLALFMNRPLPAAATIGA
jgi:hypothetical protein